MLKLEAPLLPAQIATIRSPTLWEHLSFLGGAQPDFVSTHIAPHPPYPQGPESFDARQEQKDKTLLVPSPHNKTFGNLEGHRDKRPDFFSFFSCFFSPKNKWWFVFTSRSFRATPVSKHEISRKPRQRSSIPPSREFACLQDKQKREGRGELHAKSISLGWPKLTSPTPFPKVCFLNIYSMPLEAWHTDKTRTVRDTEKGKLNWFHG